MTKQSLFASLTAAASGQPAAPDTPATPDAPVPAPATPPTAISGLGFLASMSANEAVVATAPTSTADTAAPADAASVDAEAWENLGPPPVPGAPAEEMTDYLLRKLSAVKHSITYGRDTLVELHQHLKDNPTILPPEALGDITATMRNQVSQAHRTATAAKSTALKKKEGKQKLETTVNNMVDSLGDFF